ncbi:MAG: NAD-dependent epimerase/dehydratase family protein [Alphaproteobacteria bacterium]|nr:NAD-dependent epimerase/dehydratase family protein [Alphaproteobacteria bacterium]
MAKVLVTGGAGFIGSRVVEKLLSKNYSVCVIDNLSTGKRENLPECANSTFYNQDICGNSLEEIFEKEKPDFVIHLAAQVSVGNSVSDPYDDARTNILGSINLLELSKTYNVKKFIAASSAAVYGIPKNLPIDENHPTEPISPYGLSKITMERYIRLSGVPYIIFRFSNAYGARQYLSKESGVISIFDKMMKNNEQVSIFGDGAQIRDFVYVGDIAEIFERAIASDVNNETLNFSTNKGITVNELFLMMREIYGYKKAPVFLPEREGEIRDSILSNDKVVRLLRYDKFKTLSEGLECLKNL